MHITLDTALNLLWAGLTVSALVWLACTERLRASAARRGVRVTALFLAAAAIFPAVSSSDDLLSFALLGGAGRQGGFGASPVEPTEKADQQLVHSLDSMEHGQQVQRMVPPVMLASAASKPSTVLRAGERDLPLLPGRAPPTL